ncbi:MAG: hypothetical protein A3B74_01630 [Candidatus Kerfeldbacteria bacterium RIFCSPHIGHO2_02_FULL_42_14]|uniref:PEGA domain-containing protein n=2 Tax=Bacteria TaxID=2 RepID=A0A1F4RR29_UNCSA|nr:MAG: hypothetical protein A3F86_04110 [candidate division WOR-1 bacterium RIFCSPLOWO2_12_FULL_45_9]OGY79932.1 MAG: hypothetical protein A3B74_01630 [Candidatus Kerfeldbacteria bacterium RIFCSPHIGHO2_02_FULL_42_14]OGY82317.1 MAG: hypothetical protein A3E60_03830 [Candidatus Kerfeldbacteria bacterium RIFCSPHIGHO2_12_FULL_42_13]OGY84745.1 MAG: hypothetical protein A3I91_05630 [Candidatus Kerfeldbacteria bacterium RIFCSPLOWO2_02_FULL_42_19]
MSQHFRWLFFSVFVLLFFISASIIVIATLGFRYDWQKNTFVKTGTLSIETRPENARIFLNHKVIQAKTPVVVNNLLPGELTLTIQKNGFYPWEKIIYIEPKKATVLQNVYLFKQGGTIQKMENVIAMDVIDTEHMLIARRKENARLETSFTILRLNFDNDRMTLLTTLETKPTQLFAANENVFIANFKQTHESWRVFQKDRDRGEVTTIIQQPNLVPSVIDIKPWPEEANVFFLQINTMLWRLKLLEEQEPQTEFYAENVIAFDIHNNSIVLVTQNQNKRFFIEKNLKKDTTETFPLQQATRIDTGTLNCSTTNEYTCVLKSNTETILIEKKQTFTDATVPFEVKKAIWNFNELLLLSDFELWTYDQTTDKYTLITRQSQPIYDAIWHPDSGYIIIADNNGIQAIEKNSSSTQQKIEISPTSVQALYPTIAREKIFFIKEENLQALPLGEENFL